MQTDPAVFRTATASPAGAASAQKTATAKGPGFAAVMSASQSEPIAAVQAKYDVTNITPAEVDQMFDELVDAGYPITEDLLMLSSMGERFRSHLGSITGSAPDLSRPVNLVQTAEQQLVMARSSGQGSEGWESLLRYFDSLPAPQPATAAPPLGDDRAAALRFAAQSSRA